MHLELQNVISTGKTWCGFLFDSHFYNDQDNFHIEVNERQMEPPIQCVECEKEFTSFGEYHKHDHSMTCPACELLFSVEKINNHDCFRNMNQDEKDSNLSSIRCVICSSQVPLEIWPEHATLCGEENIIQCGICFELVLIDSISLSILPCRHVTCELCVKKVCETEQNLNQYAISCPMCRKKFNPILDVIQVIFNDQASSGLNSLLISVADMAELSV
jgi:hypothetical protein